MENNIFFTHVDQNDGNVALGALPDEVGDILAELMTEWKNNMTHEQLTSTTHHNWYNDLSESLKSKVDVVRNMEIWQSLCNEKNKYCTKGKLISVPEMDEIYYFNLSAKIKSGRLYGAHGNVDAHTDSMGLFKFNKLKLYRVLIGLSNDNKNTITKFINAKVQKKINKLDYAVFDFNRTLHQVIKENPSNNPRFLLKLHFVVCEECDEPDWKIALFKNIHILYEVITRYVMDNGTDPKSWYDFFLGVIFEIDSSVYIATILTTLYVLINVYNIKDSIQLAKYTLFVVCFVYLIIVTIFWTWYELTGER